METIKFNNLLYFIREYESAFKKPAQDLWDGIPDDFTTLEDDYELTDNLALTLEIEADDYEYSDFVEYIDGHRRKYTECEVKDISVLYVGASGEVNGFEYDHEEFTRSQEKEIFNLVKELIIKHL